MDENPPSFRERWQSRYKQLFLNLKKIAPFVAGVLAALLAIFLYSSFAPKTPQLTAKDVNEAVANALASATPAPAYSELVYQVIRPSLVFIEAKALGKDGKEAELVGSGVIITEQGDILTALHVVDKATEIQVIFADGTHSSAQVVNTQADIDIAVLRADQPPGQIVPATLGNPRSMQVGDEAYAVGNPFGLYSSMTSGVISGFNRTFQSPDNDKKLEGLIQIDAAVNPGNSGGPLLNRAGQVIGIVEGIANPTGQDFFVGIGFAVPINIAGAAVGLPPD